MSASPDEVAAGHAFYTRTTLRLYDPMILGFFSRLAWQCPKARIPGSIRDKAVVMGNLVQLARPGGVLFGATLLHDGVERNWLARQVMARNNRVGIFCNSSDDLDGLRWALDQHLAATEVTTVGSVAIFSGRVPE